MGANWVADLWQKEQEIININIELSHVELLVLYDLLHRLEDAEGIFQDMAELQMLWHIQAQLDKELVEPFQADYQATIKVVCRTVREQH